MAKLEILEKVFKKAEEQKKSVLLIGKYGIGKSSIVYQYAEKRAKELNRKLVLWHELSESEKKEVIENVEKYYVLVDIKGSMISPENLIIPFSENGELVWKVPLWARVFEKENSAGVLFIDEINMTPPSLQSILFELILQRKIGETALKSKNLLVVGAGNDLESNEFANEIPKPLLNRFILINFDELVSIDSFLEYAKMKKLDHRIISYVLYKNNIFTAAKESLKQSTTPRSLEMLSDMIKGENDLEYIRFVAKALLEENDAIEFVAFVEMYEKLKDIEKYLKDIEALKQLRTDEQYVVIMKITEKVSNNKINIKDYVEFLERLYDIIAEFVIASIKLLKVLNEQKFGEFIEYLVENSKDKLLEKLSQVVSFT